MPLFSVPAYPSFTHLAKEGTFTVPINMEPNTQVGRKIVMQLYSWASPFPHPSPRETKFLTGLSNTSKKILVLLPCVTVELHCCCVIRPDTFQNKLSQYGISNIFFSQTRKWDFLSRLFLTKSYKSVFYHHGVFEKWIINKEEMHYHYFSGDYEDNDLNLLGIIVQNFFKSAAQFLIICKNTQLSK